MCLICELSSTIELSSIPEYASITRNFETFGSKWGENQVPGSSGGAITYSFAASNAADQFGNFSSFITDEDFKNEIISAFSVWETTSDIRFVLSLDSPTVDIRIGWGNLDGPFGVLGQTIIPSAGPLRSVTIAFDEAENWFLGGDAPASRIDFSSTAIHEIGHAIGIDHSTSATALMNANYSTSIFDLQQDDIDAAIAIYGANEISTTSIFRFFNPGQGGHFFTADPIEKELVELNGIFLPEGVGFLGIESTDGGREDVVPVYRFFNTITGGHFFTAFEVEKDTLLENDSFIFEGIGFRAFSFDSSSTLPVHRFFDTVAGGHLFTSSDTEKEIVMSIPQFRYEGEAFYTYA